MHVYCLGIGGIGMSYVVRYLLSQGHHVSGTDKADSEPVARLRAEGVQIVLGHDHPVPEDVDLVLLSPAVAIANPPDLQEARRRGIPVQTWQEYLGAITAAHQTLAICGVHGKSTTTAMAGVAMTELGLDPTVMVGSFVPSFGGSNLRLGRSPWLVLEADEYHENFLSYQPAHILCTSYEPDHLDYFGTEENYARAYVRFFAKLPDEGRIFYHAADTRIAALIAEAGKVGVPVPEEPLTLAVPGAHNRANARLVRAFLLFIGEQPTAIAQSLLAFTGTWRRQELLGTLPDGTRIYDDYAHTPTEIDATVAALREAYPAAELVAVFQPHQYSRTRLFFDGFVQAGEGADRLLVMDIYESRDTEEDKRAVNSTMLVDAMRAAGRPAEYVGSVDQTLSSLQALPPATRERVLVFMGAGTITRVAHALL